MAGNLHENVTINLFNLKTELWSNGVSIPFKQDLGLNFSTQFRPEESNKENEENEENDDPNSRQFFNVTSNSIPSFSPFGDSSRKLLSRGAMRMPHDPPMLVFPFLISK